MFLFLSIPYVSAAPTRPSEAPQGTQQELTAYATKEAVQSKIEPSEVLAVIECESAWNPEALGDHGTSFGLVQIHNPEQQGIMIEQADNPYFAISFLVKGISEGHADRWSCYKN